MRNLWAIAVKELRSYFVSPVGYVALAFWLFGVGLFFTLGVVQGRQATLQDWFGTVEVLLLFVGPALTMRLLAEEQRTGTLELLLTAPVRDWEVVVGKYIGVLLFWLAMVASTFVYPIILKLVGNPDMGPIFSGYLGLILLGAAFLALGVFTSSLSSNQVIAYIIGFVILLTLWIIGFLTPVLPAGSQLSNFLTALSVTQHFEDFGKGVIDAANILFYLSLVVAALFATIQIMEARRVRQ
ncbi:MAG TPA: ABC transporter permease [Chloroflexia bacterium]|nr:ABC transporter permease [Chloroflexia bacterium]